MSLGLSSDNGQFTSQLSVRVSPDIVGENLTCEHNDGSRILPIGLVEMSAGRSDISYSTYTSTVKSE